MAKKMSPVVQVVAIGIGAALFFVLGRFAAIPTPIPNVSIALQYAILAVFAVLFGPVSGSLIGGIGHVLIDATGYGIWASWEISSAVVGLIIGAMMIGNKVYEGELPTKTIVRFNISVVVAHALSWMLVAPLGDILIYSEPANKVFVQGVTAFASNALTTGIIGTLVLIAYAKTRTQTGSLSTEA
ncbi:ECF-type riboflavin transporter substrate-binding protein [Arcanobacterium phocisimile]|uniref:ECF-type riboflavin transporter substrate-binding protein n=1 Tax=Arcanobacterium phocisimile TaxID=1302235 RepID=A0ABX7IER4_9ACTO|nr:ECF-type riboflavin transporter substrate-binding protein [Arcanobacterium phocisimile]QRV01631.1 ECF-type riboflavin transporter substrate-binding protein [Arcanobacterium phocisimile]